MADSVATSVLVVKPPFAGMLVDGFKTWELRSTNTTRVGERVAIAAAGTSTIVGEVTIVDSVKIAENGVSLLPLPISDFEFCHRVPDLGIVNYRTMYAWVMAQPERYPEPKPYVHPQGAVIWVSLEGSSKSLAKKRKAKD